MTFVPTFRATAGIVQVGAACAVPEKPWFVDQESVRAPTPPESAPDKATVDAVVVDAGACTTSSKVFDGAG